MAPQSITVAAAAAGLVVAASYLPSLKGKSPFVKDFSSIAQAVDNVEVTEAHTFDIIIIGGGTAGCALASRLSEDPSIKVLLLEAGQSSAQLAPSFTPAGWSTLFKSPQDWAFYTTPQSNAGGHQAFWPRGKMLGGCSSMNAMMYHHGCPQDYDKWAQLQKGQKRADEWSYEQLAPYFRKHEKYTPNAKYSEVDVMKRSNLGLVQIGHDSFTSPGADLFIRACANAGIPHTHDVNTAAGTLGVTRPMTFVDSRGARVTAETAYLTAQVMARSNLKVATGALVERIVFSTSGTTPRAVGVQFSDGKGKQYTVGASKEVVLSAGAIGSPQILQLSGVGPASHLNSHGIPVVVDLPGVGSHLQDHVAVSLAYMDKHKSSLSYLRPKGIVQNLQAIAALLQYKLTGKGPLTNNIGEVMAFAHSSNPKLFPADKFTKDSLPEDTASGHGGPDLEIIYTPLSYRNHGFSPPPNFGAYNVGIHAILLQPKSAGTVRLSSTNPSDPPQIDPQYLADSNDVKTLIRGLRLCDSLAHTEPMVSVLDPAGDNHPELNHRLSELSDSALEDMIRNGCFTLFHPCCSARMAPLEDGGVVDTSLRVYGIPNLRVVDASVFPSIISGHTTSPVYAVAEKAADLIKSALQAQKT